MLCCAALQAIHQHDLHNPNHADILRTMWPLFELLVRSSNRVPLAAQVFTPLLSSEAIGMLTSCLNSPQRDFWHSMGDAWVVSRYADALHCNTNATLTFTYSYSYMHYAMLSLLNCTGTIEHRIL